MTITISRTGDKIHVQFPIELNVAFKPQFKTAIWKSGARAWEINLHPRNEAKLQRWVSEVEASNVLESLQLAKEVEQDELDLSRLLSELGQLRRQTERSRDLKTRLAEVKGELADARTTLDTARRDAERAAQDAARERQAVLDLVKGVIDLEAVRNAHDTMKRYSRQVGSAARDRYHAAQETIRRERDKLAAAGFRSRGLNALAGANFNRPDRDDPGKIGQDDLLDLHPLTPPENTA